MRGLINLLLIFGIVGSMNSFGKLDDASGDGANPVTSGTTPPPATSSASPSSTQISIPCINDAGAVVGGGAGSCKMILPKCTDLINSFTATIKSKLSWKIWGYYQGKDLDLTQTSLTALVGTNMKDPICSVVGHTMKFNGSKADFELSNQSIANKLTCGQLPGVTAHDDAHQIEFSYTGGQGGMWNSYLLGAFPWLIRKNTSDVLNQIAPDLSNISDVVQSSAAMKAQVAAFGVQMSSFYSHLASTSQDVCNGSPGDQPGSLLSRCLPGTPNSFSISDPAARICQMVNSQSAMNMGALPNILITEIMTRVQNQYDDMFSTLLNHNNQEFNSFFDECQADNSTGIFGLEPRRPYSCAASCMFGGADYITNSDYSIAPSQGRGRASRRCTELAAVNLKDGSLNRGGANFAPGIKTNLVFNNVTSTKVNDTHTANLGFAGFIEYLIRAKICGQQHLNDDTVCDSIQIPDKPAELK